MHEPKLDPKKKERIEAMRKRRKSRAAALCSRLDNVIQLDQLGPGPEPPDQSERRIKLKAYKVKKGKSFGDSLCCTPSSGAGMSSELSSKLDHLIEFQEEPDPNKRSHLRGALKGAGFGGTFGATFGALGWRKLGGWRASVLGGTLGAAKYAAIGAGIGGVVGADKKKKELSAKLDEILFDDRPRNQLGEFSGQQEGAPDPNSMAKVYGAGQRKGILEGAGAALAGGGLGTVGGSAGKSIYKAGGKLFKNFMARAKKTGKIIVPK